jgi:hypothetical protein
MTKRVAQIPLGENALYADRTDCLGNFLTVPLTVIARAHLSSRAIDILAECGRLSMDDMIRSYLLLLYLILSYLILFYFILFYFILSCFILSYLRSLCHKMSCSIISTSELLLIILDIQATSQNNYFCLNLFPELLLSFDSNQFDSFP